MIMIHHDSDSSKQCKPVKQLDMLITVDLCCEPCNCSKGKQTGHMEQCKLKVFVVHVVPGRTRKVCQVDALDLY